MLHPVVEAELPGPDGGPELRLFSESASRAVLSCAPAQTADVLARARAAGVPATRIGRTGGPRLRISPGVDVSVAEAHDAWARTLPEALG